MNVLLYKVGSNLESLVKILQEVERISLFFGYSLTEGQLIIRDYHPQVVITNNPDQIAQLNPSNIQTRFLFVSQQSGKEILAAVKAVKEQAYKEMKR